MLRNNATPATSINQALMGDTYCRLGASRPLLGGVGKIVEHRFRSLGET